MASKTVTGSAVFLGQTNYTGSNSVGSVLNFTNSEVTQITMVSDPSSTGSPLYGTWDNTNNGSLSEDYTNDDNNLDLGEAVRMDTDGDGDLTGEPWLKVMLLDRYRLDIALEDGSIVNGVGVIIKAQDPTTGRIYQSMVFGDRLVDTLNGTGLNIVTVTLAEYIRTGTGGLDLSQVFVMSSFANSLATFEVAPCFARGTWIDTDRGERRIEDLKIGDRVRTADHGYQEIRWIGRKSVPATGKLAPIVFRAGALGNDRELIVSPQHRMLMRGEKVHLMFGEPEVFVPAKSLVNGANIFIRSAGWIEYFHILLDSHEIVFANGCPAESLYLGRQAMRAFDDTSQQEIHAIFPDLAELHRIGGTFRSARKFLTCREGRQLSENTHTESGLRYPDKLAS